MFGNRASKPVRSVSETPRAYQRQSSEVNWRRGMRKAYRLYMSISTHESPKSVHIMENGRISTAERCCLPVTNLKGLVSRSSSDILLTLYVMRGESSIGSKGVWERRSRLGLRFAIRRLRTGFRVSGARLPDSVSAQQLRPSSDHSTYSQTKSRSSEQSTTDSYNPKMRPSASLRMFQPTRRMMAPVPVSLETPNCLSRHSRDGFA